WAPGARVDADPLLVVGDLELRAGRPGLTTEDVAGVKLPVLERDIVVQRHGAAHQLRTAGRTHPGAAGERQVDARASGGVQDEFVRRGDVEGPAPSVHHDRHAREMVRARGRYG